MTPDELRALADALQPMAAAPCFDGIDIERAAAHLRAQADAQPVAYRQWNSDEGYWYYGDASCAEKDDELPYTHPAPTAPHHAMLDSHRRLVEQAIQSAEHPSGMSTHDGKARIDASILRRMLAIIDSLPAVPQAEPKREPLSDERIDEIGDPFGYFQYGDAQGDKRRAFARAVERAAYERAVQECIETAAELRRCADGCTDGRYDWKADGADDCADAIRALGGQHD